MQRVFPSRSQVWYYPLDFHKPTSGAPMGDYGGAPKKLGGGPCFSSPWNAKCPIFLGNWKPLKPATIALKIRHLAFQVQIFFFWGEKKAAKSSEAWKILCFFWIPAKCENPWLQIHLWGGIPLSGTGSVRKSSAIASLKRESFEYVWGKN